MIWYRSKRLHVEKNLACLHVMLLYRFSFFFCIFFFQIYFLLDLCKDSTLYRKDVGLEIWKLFEEIFMKEKKNTYEVGLESQSCWGKPNAYREDRPSPHNQQLLWREASELPRRTRRVTYNYLKHFSGLLYGDTAGKVTKSHTRPWVYGDPALFAPHPWLHDLFADYSWLLLTAFLQAFLIKLEFQKDWMCL
jgi:hypothetical protein